MTHQAFLHHQVERAILRLYEDLATPLSLKVSLLYKYGEWDQLASLAVDPGVYLDSESYWRDATAASVLRKLVELPTTIDRKVVAEEGFLANEKVCLSTNRRLFPYLCPGLPDTDEGVCAYLERARKICAYILGSCPELVDGRFGPGATYGDRGRLTTVPDKMTSQPTLTRDAWPFLFQWSGTLWAKALASSRKDPLFVQGNRFTTVPKDASKDRGIAIEPSLNVFYQLGYGKVIRSRLKRVGINLTHGQDIHRRVACEASIRGHLFTMDLSNASDTICRNLVKLLLPTRWFSVLDDLRSKKTEFRGDWHLLEKFSSMGNGFTFELETLIFLALLLALDSSWDDPQGRHVLNPGVNVFVYGDDIIAPVEFSKDAAACLSFFGMSVNKRKTFVDGPFRESCGGDFFFGKDVRPYFLKESPSEPHQLISLANGLRRLSRGAESRSCHVNRAWFGVLDALPSAIRCLRGPEDLGDIVLHDTQDRWQLRCRASGIRYIKVYRPVRFSKVSLRNFKPDVVLAAAVYGLGPKGSEGVIPRDPVVGRKIGWVPYS
jgi:hypothetical protein